MRIHSCLEGGGVEQVGCGHSLNKGVCMVGVEIAHFYLAFIRSIDAGKDCGFGGLQLWDCLRQCVFVSNVVLGAAFGKGLRMCVCVCAYVHTSSVCLLYMVSARLHFASITFSMCQASCLLKERAGLDKADWWGLRDTMVNWSQQVAVNSFLPGLLIILPVSLLAEGLRRKLSAIVYRSNFLIKKFRS